MQQGSKKSYRVVYQTIPLRFLCDEISTGGISLILLVLDEVVEVECVRKEDAK